MKPIFYAYMITVLVFSACSSGKSTFERGNYYEAVITSVNRLRKNSDHKKSVETLRMAYPMAVSFYEDRANTAIASTEPFKWSQVVNSYTTINHMYDEIKRCPGALKVVPNPVNYFSKLEEARKNAAEENYAAGILALQFGEREKAKQAYAYFKTANGYVAGYKDVISYMEAALDAATVKILVEPIPVHSKAAGVSAEFFNDKISEFVHTAPINEFVRFYTRAEAEKIKINPDHIIQLQFDDFNVGQIHKQEREIQLSKDSVVMGTYLSASTANQENNDGGRTSQVGRTGLVTGGSGVVASTQPPINTNTNNNNTNTATQTTEAEKAAMERGEKERVARELAEKSRAEQAERERALAEKLRLEREAAERERAAREAADRAKAEQNLAEKALAEKATAEREKAEAERLAKERAERESAEKARLEKERAEREKAESERLEKARAEKEAAEKAQAEKTRLEKEKAERESAEKEKAEKAKKDKYVDPTINSADTLNVKDPVTICHVPPGNNMQRRTLVISRAALKAHLGHGDIEGGCEGDKKGEKEKLKGGEKGKPQGDIKGKGPGAGNTLDKNESNKNERAARYDQGPVFFASADEDPEQFLRYLAFQYVASDTNKVYGTVKATLYHNKKTTTANGVVSFRIIDAKTGSLLSVEKMPGEFVWVSEWATFNGDERALSAEQLQLTRLKEQPAPPPQELFIEFTRPIYDQITTKIREFYKGY